MELILASQSHARQHILKSANIPFVARAAYIDEDEIKKSLLADGAGPRDIADTLAELKAQKVSNQNPDAYVLGCDQVVRCQKQLISKPATQAELKTTLANMAGETLNLYSANVIYQAGKPIWRHVGRADLSLRHLSEDEIDSYINTEWEGAKHSAGGILFESNPWMFSAAKGDWFDIMGLSLRPILAYLKMRSDQFSGAQVPKMAGIFGHPINHSKSPTMHRHWLKKQHIAGDYIPINTPPAYFDETVNMLLSLGFAGFNVTIPHKEAAFRVAQEKTDRAGKMGAVNTLYRGTGGTLIGDSTDGEGFMQSLIHGAPTWAPDAGPALILGAGGAARSIIWALIDAGIPKIYLTNRTAARAQQIASEVGAMVEVVNWEQKSKYVPMVKTIINTTSQGMKGKGRVDLDLSRAAKDTIVTDIVYTPLETEFLKRASDQGCITVDGLGMLLHQGVEGFEKWFGPRPIVDEDLRSEVLK